MTDFDPDFIAWAQSLTATEQMVAFFKESVAYAALLYLEGADAGLPPEVMNTVTAGWLINYMTAEALDDADLYDYEEEGDDD